MNITVYLGANEGSDPALKQAVEELGRWIGESGNALVYGGSRSGLMGRLAHSVLTAGANMSAGLHSLCNNSVSSIFFHTACQSNRCNNWNDLNACGLPHIHIFFRVSGTCGNYLDAFFYNYFCYVICMWA